MSARRVSRGFSLLEAAAAVALLGLALPAILTVFSDTTSRIAVAEDRLDTLRRAQNLIVLAKAQFHGAIGLNSGSDAAAKWVVNASLLSFKERPETAGSSGPVPIHLAVTVQSKRGAEVQLNTVFLFEASIR